MSRSSGYVVARATLVTEGALRVGASRSTNDVDLPLLRDGLGRSLVPGTSLAGALRAWCVDRSMPAAVVDALFGGHEGQLGASRLIIADMATDRPPTLRTGVGIDRATGTAANGVLMSFEVLPHGTSMDLELELELPTDAALATALRSALGAMLDALTRGDISLGGSTRRGLGAVRLVANSLTLTAHEFTNPAATLAALSGGTALQRVELGSMPLPTQSVRISVAWHPLGTVMSKAGADGLAVDMLPLMEATADGGLVPVLPGSSVKGILRSATERWWRTLNAREASPTVSSDEFIEQLVTSPFIDTIFGAIADDGTERRSRRGALAVHDCQGQRVVPAKVWAEIAEQDDIVDVARIIDTAGLTTMLSPAMHVAIDRFTGGAADNFLFSTLEVRDAHWAPLVLHLDLPQVRRGAEGAHAEELAYAAVGLVLVLVRMLDEGMVRLGFATQRGSGRVIVDKVSIVVDGATSADSPLQRLQGEYTHINDELSTETVQPFLSALSAQMKDSVR